MNKIIQTGEYKRTFSLTSELFFGEVLFEFLNDVLGRFDVSGAELNEQQHVFIAKYLPRELAEVERFLARSETLTFTETTTKVDFEMFWKRYFQSRSVDNSSKKRAQIRWGKMPKSERLKAFNHIGKYMNNLRSGIEPKHAETYLNHELWNN